MPPLNKEFESNVPPQTWKTSLSALLLVTVHINTFFTWLRTFVAKSALLRLRAFREALLTKIWWLGAYKYFIGPVLSYWLTVRLFSTGSTNSLQEASILFQHIILPQVIVLFVECRSFPPHLRTFLSNFVATDVYALSLKSLPGVFFPFLVWAKFWVALLHHMNSSYKLLKRSIDCKKYQLHIFYTLHTVHFDLLMPVPCPRPDKLL